MKKKHHATLKFHTIYSIVVSVAFLVTLLIVRDITLGLSMAALVLYVGGNGIIHARKSQLTRDTLVEYVLMAVIVLVVLLGASL